LDRQSDIERKRSDAFHQQLADGMVNMLSHDTLAERDRLFDGLALADVVRQDSALACVVTDRHLATTDAGHHHAL
jgi:hypothetical protein